MQAMHMQPDEDTSLNKYTPVLILIGPPGCGKGTQGDRIVAAFGFPKISTGALLRDEMKAGTEVGKKVAGIMASGGLVDDQIVLDVLVGKLHDKPYDRGVILDGFPRSQPQAMGLSKMLTEAESGKQFKVLVMHIDAPDSALLERMSNRYYCSQCQTNYNKLYKNPVVAGVCDVCGARDAFAVRDDDKPETIKSRLRTYHEQTEPVLAYYSKLGLLSHVSGDAAEDVIFNQLAQVIRQQFLF
jgi:adenylate kinase